MFPYPESWNGHEQVIDALERHGLSATYQQAIAASDSLSATRSLIAVGVEHEAAAEIVMLAMTATKFNLN